MSTYISYDHNKFGDDTSCLTEEESGKVAPKKDFIMKIGILLANLPSEDEVISSKQPILHVSFFSCTFKTPSFFTVAIWQRVKPEPHREGSQKQILGISEPLEILLKVITKVG